MPSVTETQDITVTGWGPCTVSMLLVGGGGQGGGSGYGGGAGAGHLQFLSVRLEPGTKLRAEVGDQRQASSVTFSGASLAQGQGYGGGGNGYSEFADGLQGVVLVEATSEFK